MQPGSPFMVNGHAATACSFMMTASLFASVHNRNCCRLLDFESLIVCQSQKSSGSDVPMCDRQHVSRKRECEESAPRDRVSERAPWLYRKGWCKTYLVIRIHMLCFVRGGHCERTAYVFMHDLRTKRRTTYIGYPPGGRGPVPPVFSAVFCLCSLSSVYCVRSTLAIAIAALYGICL